MEIELTDRLRTQADIILGLYDLTAEQDEAIIQEWLRRVREIPAQLYAGASLGFMEVFLTRVLADLIDEHAGRN